MGVAATALILAGVLTNTPWVVAMGFVFALIYLDRMREKDKEND